MTRDEMIDVVNKIDAVDGSEEDIARLVLSLERSLPYVNVVDLLFHDFRELTPEQLVDEAMAIEAGHGRELNRG